MNNLVGKPEFARLQKQMENILAQKLKETKDEFLSGPVYLERWNYPVDESGTVPYTN